MRRRAFALLVLLAQPALAADCLPMFCKFSVSGKKGAYLTAQVKPEALVAADAKMKGPLADGRSLANVSTHRGALAGTGLSMPFAETALRDQVARMRALWPATLRPPMPVDVRIIGDTAFNPAAQPDGVIVVPLGVLMRAQSDDEVFWVLAHEFSHIGLAHFSREADQRQLKSAVSSAIDGVQIAADLSQQRVDTSGNQVRVYQVNDKGAQAMSNGVWAHGQDAKIILELFNQQLSRKQEDQADAAGLDLAVAAGFGDDSFGAALDRVAEDEARAAVAVQSMDKQLAIYMQAEAGQTLQQVTAQGANLNAITNTLFDSLKRNITRVLTDKLVSMASESHRPAAKRKEGLGAYADAAALLPKDAPPRDARHDWLDRIRATPEFRDGQTAVAARDRALEMLKAPGTDPVAIARTAMTALQPAQATRYASTPLIANAAARIYDAAGMQADADRLYDLADKGLRAAPPAPAKPASGKKPRKAVAPAPVAVATGPRIEDTLYEQSLEGFHDHVALLIRMRNYPKALAIIAHAKTQFGDDEAFLPQQVTIAMQTNQNEVLTSAMARCLSAEDVNLGKQCRYAMLTDDAQKKLDTMAPADRAKVETAMAKTSDTARRSSWLDSIGKALKPAEGQ